MDFSISFSILNAALLLSLSSSKTGILTDETFGWREVVGSTMIVVGGVLAVVLATKEEK